MPRNSPIKLDRANRSARLKKVSYNPKDFYGKEISDAFEDGEDDDDENEVKASKSKSSNGRKKSSSSIKPLDFCASIAHTRWATHGPPNKINTHPHTSDSRENEFVVVHNGIITNHAPLRAMLERRGMKFETDTDTEVIPKLCKFLSDKFEAVSYTHLTLPTNREV